MGWKPAKANAANCGQAGSGGSCRFQPLMHFSHLILAYSVSQEANRSRITYRGPAEPNLTLLLGISSPMRGSVPSRRFVKGPEIRSRLAISEKLCRLQGREFFSHRRGNELIYAVLSSLLCRSTAFFREGGSRKGYVIDGVTLLPS